jgi:hypothetical protein
MSKITTAKRAGGMAQVVNPRLSKYEALNSNPGYHHQKSLEERVAVNPRGRDRII